MYGSNRRRIDIALNAPPESLFFPKGTDTYMRFKKLIAAVLCVALGISSCGCKKSDPLLTEPDTPPVLTAHKTVKLGSSGAFEITRRDIGNTPMGENGTWTIFVYMSGTDLEEMRANGTKDIKEMIAASTGENVKFIVQTGGSNRWQNDYANSESLGRFLISDGKLTKLAYVSLDSMAKASTLRNFLKWGIENHPAEKMGLIFWGHGKGTIGGVCKDDLFGGKYLSLESINSALSEAAELMTDKFEFLGFDNCYMATVEVADIAASYANYMIASEEIEPANGWDYTVLGNLLGSDPHADWNTIAKTLCDGFFANNSDSDNIKRTTLSVIELSKLDDFLVKFDAYAGDLCGALGNITTLTEFETFLDGAEHFGNNNGFAGYSNSIDIGDLIKAGSKFSNKTEELLSTLNDMVIYQRLGEDHKNANGLTVYYPFEPRGSAELKTFGRHCVSPRYLELIDRKQLGTALVPNESTNDNNTVAELWCDDINSGTRKLDEYFGGASEPEFNGDETEKSTIVEFTEEPKHENGSYTLSIAPNSLDKISRVGISVFRESENYRFFALGTKPCSNADLKTGTFSDALDGHWLMLKNREPLQIKQRTDGKYITQLKIGKNETTMLFTYNESKKTAAIDGLWSNDESGALSFKKPAPGDKISAFYDICTKKAEKFHWEKGSEYIISDEPNIIYDALGDGSYYYMVIVDDIRGNRYETEPVKFAINNGQLDFNPQPEDENISN